MISRRFFMENRYVIIRDDDTNFHTPIECLEKIFAPFWNKNLSINLSVIPRVSSKALSVWGTPEGFLSFAENNTANTEIYRNEPLLKYLKNNPLIEVVTHGYDHRLFEFTSNNRNFLIEHLKRGAEYMQRAGLNPLAFVPPYDEISKEAFNELIKRFKVISLHHWDSNKIPRSARPKCYARTHWEWKGVKLLSHDDLVWKKKSKDLLSSVQAGVKKNSITVITSHWHEFFPDGKENIERLRAWHSVADWLHKEKITALTFSQLAAKEV